MKVVAALCGRVRWGSEDVIRAYNNVVTYRELDLPSLHCMAVVN